MVEGFADRGWARFGAEPSVAEWARAALAALEGRALCDLRLGATWDVGLESLANDGLGTVGDVPLRGRAITAVRALYGDLPLHRAQVSTVLPGYPRPSPEESAAAHAYRRNRDGAHVDGLLPIGPRRHRMVREPHAYILGLPLTDCGAGASPLVVWQGSHRIMARALAEGLGPLPEADRPHADITEAYHRARREVFATCPRVVLAARPGEALLVHRLALHGISPWAEGAVAPEAGRISAYFRPCLASIGDWLAL